MKGVIVILIFLTVLMGGRLEATTIAENTWGGELIDGKYYYYENVVTTYLGQSVTTPSGGPWNDITFNWYEPFAGAPFAGTPIAPGDLYILNVEYLGTPANLVNLGNSTPGFVAKSIANSGGQYAFDTTVTLLPNTTYYFYADYQFQPEEFGIGGTFPGGTIYLNYIPAGNVGDAFQAFNGGDANFSLKGFSDPEPISIDIKPGSDPNSINPKSKGKIPVAIISTEDFDATSQVDQHSLTFGATGDERSLAFCNPKGEDINGDGLKDLVCHFNTQSTEFVCGDTEGILKGKTKDGMSIEGSDSVRIIPCK